MPLEAAQSSGPRSSRRWACGPVGARRARRLLLELVLVHQPREGLLAPDGLQEMLLALLVLRLVYPVLVGGLSVHAAPRALAVNCFAELSLCFRFACKSFCFRTRSVPIRFASNFGPLHPDRVGGLGAMFKLRLSYAESNV